MNTLVYIKLDALQHLTQAPVWVQRSSLVIFAHYYVERSLGTRLVQITTCDYGPVYTLNPSYAQESYAPLPGSSLLWKVITYCGQNILPPFLK